MHLSRISQKSKTDLQIIMGMLRCRNDKTKLVKYVNDNEEYFGAADVETAYI